MLKDTAHIQEIDAEFTAKRIAKRCRRSTAPTQDAERALESFQAVAYHQDKPSGRGVSYRCLDAGHMLGSSSILMEQNGTRLVFSGDVGRRRLPIAITVWPLRPSGFVNPTPSIAGDRRRLAPL